MENRHKSKSENVSAVSEEVAQGEVKKWLDTKNYPKSKREQNKDQIEALEEAIVDGYLVLNDDNTLTHKLLNPILGEGEVPVLTELTYKARLNWSEVELYMKGVKATDAFGLINAHICALTKKNTGMIKKLDSVDMNLSRSVATFFL